MELMTVSQVSRSPGISTRMLRYYEQAGLVESLRQEGYAYRIYDKKAVLRLKQILMLRRLRIPVRQIKAILQKEDAVAAIEIFRENIRNLNEEMTALSVVKEILNHFVEELSRTAELPLEKILLKDDVLADSIVFFQKFFDKHRYDLLVLFFSHPMRNGSFAAADRENRFRLRQ